MLHRKVLLPDNTTNPLGITLHYCREIGFLAKAMEEVRWRYIEFEISVPNPTAAVILVIVSHDCAKKWPHFRPQPSRHPGYSRGLNYSRVAGFLMAFCRIPSRTSTQLGICFTTISRCGSSANDSHNGCRWCGYCEVYSTGGSLHFAKRIGCSETYRW